MNWQAVAAQLAQLGLPILGRLLGGMVPMVGGFLGGEGGLGEQAGGLVARAIATALGVEPTPEAIGRAIEQKPTSEVVTKLQAIEAEAAAKWPALAEIAKVETEGETEVAKINAEANARAVVEIASNGFWLSLYRSILMYAATAQLAAFGIVFFYALLLDQSLWSRVTSGMDLIKWWLGANASVLGVHFYTRGKEREAAATGQAQGPIVGTAAKVAKAVKK